MEQENAIVSSYNSEQKTCGGDRWFFTKYTKGVQKRNPLPWTAGGGILFINNKTINRKKCGIRKREFL
jgi:hypothetical protein